MAELEVDKIKNFFSDSMAKVVETITETPDAITTERSETDNDGNSFKISEKKNLKNMGSDDAASGMTGSNYQGRSSDDAVNNVYPASNIFDELRLENKYKNPSDANAGFLNEPMELTTDDIKNIESSRNTQAALSELDKDIKFADGDKAAISKAGEDFMDGMGTFFETNPQLAKSATTMMGAMLLGEDFQNAMTTGFGIVQETKELEEAATEAQGQKVVEMLIENAEYINPEVLENTLNEYNFLSPAERKNIELLFGISRTKGLEVLDKERIALNKEQLLGVTTAWKDMSDAFLTKDNKPYLKEAIDRLQAYVMSKRGRMSILNLEERNTISSTISAWVRLANDGMEDSDYSTGYQKAGSMEAIYEGMHGQVRKDSDGNFVRDINVPEKYSGHNMVILETLRTKGISGLKNEEEINEWLAKKEAIFQDSVAGKGPYGALEKDDDGNLDYPEYINWLYNQVKRDFSSK